MTAIKFEGLDGYKVLNESWTTDSISLNGIQSISIQTVVDTSDAYGEIAYEKSNDATNWTRVYYVDDTDLSTVQDGYDLTGSSCRPMVEFPQVTYGFIRIKYTRTSGTGGLTWRAVTKKNR